MAIDRSISSGSTPMLLLKLLSEKICMDTRLLRN